MSPDVLMAMDLGTMIGRFIEHEIGQSPPGIGRPLIVGLCGAQGIGKSTVSVRIAAELEAHGRRTLVIGLDDLYLTKSQREHLARTIHPMLATRGVPGTHDIALGLALLDAAGKHAPLALPRFDKANDYRLPRALWPVVASQPEIILFEGWCVGAVPQAQGELVEPINELERLEDPECVWRDYVNEILAGDYQLLFARLDALVLLAAPSFEIISAWRHQQEVQLSSGLKEAPGRLKSMSRADIDRFVLHYERLTRHIIREMPGRADFVLQLDANRRLAAISGRGAHPYEALGD